jgi:hypothetical protein
MKTIRTKIYQFNELKTEAARQNAINWLRENEDFQYLFDEANESLKAFAEVFNITIRHFDFLEPNRKEVYFNHDDIVLELSGLRLAKYIWNNYGFKIYKPKFIGCVEVDKQIKHNRVKSERLTSPGRRVDWFNPYYSAIWIEEGCPFTGMAFDYDILDPIYIFLKHPTGTTFEDLLAECLDSLCKSVEGEYIGRNKDEEIIESIIANEYWFTQDGKIYHS